MATKVNQTIDSLYDGVSRRPPSQRLASEAQEQTNMFALTRDKIARRPPLEHLAKIMSDSTGYTTAFVEEIRRSDSENYIVLIINGDLRVFDSSSGAEIAVTFLNGKAYLSSALGFRHVTIGDTTVIANRSKIVRKGTEKAPALTKEALLYVRQGDYQTTYTIGVGSVIVTHTTPSSGRNTIATDYIATQIVNALNANIWISDGFTVTRYGSTIHLVHKQGVEFGVTATDGLGDLGIIAIKGTVQRFTDLPPKAKPGFTVEVKGDDSTEFDNYFVQYTEANTPVQAGTWKEVAQPDSIIAIDRTTLPHSLEYKGKFLQDTARMDDHVLPTVRQGTHVNGSAVITGNIVEFTSTATYAPNAAVVVTFQGTSFTYTNVTAGFVTAAVMCEGVRALIDIHANYVANVLTTTSFECWRVAPDDQFVVTATITYDNTKNFANSSLAMTVNEHIGRTIQNTTDGSSATITSNTAVSVFNTVALAGGADNRFDAGDLCNIVGTGIYFIFGQSAFAKREAGTTKTVPFPSFVDHTINGVCEHQGRLGVLSGPNVALSRAGADNIFNFFRRTATQQLDDDLIDFRSASSTPAFDSAVNWNSSLLLLSDKGQYALEATPVLSPTTVTLPKKAEYQALSSIVPKVLGASALFVGLRNGLPMLLDFRIRGSEQIAVAEDTSIHIPGYIRGTPLQIEVDDTNEIVYLRTDADRRSIYVLVLHYENNQRVQSAWSKWTVDADSEIVSTLALKGRLLVVTKDTQGLWLSTLKLDATQNKALLLGAEGPVFLDRICTTRDVVGYAYAGGVTTWAVPYWIDNPGGRLRVVVMDTSGQLTKLSTYGYPGGGSGNLVRALGDYTGQTAFVGISYESRYRFSRIYRRDQNGVADQRGALYLAFVEARYEDTQDASIEIRDLRKTWLANDGSIEGPIRALPSHKVTLAKVSPDSSDLRCAVMARSDKIEVDLVTSEPLQMAFSSMAWEGEVQDTRGSRF